MQTCVLAECVGEQQLAFSISFGGWDETRPNELRWDGMSCRTGFVSVVWSSLWEHRSRSRSLVEETGANDFYYFFICCWCWCCCNCFVVIVLKIANMQNAQWRLRKSTAKMLITLYLSSFYLPVRRPLRCIWWMQMWKGLFETASYSYRSQDINLNAWVISIGLWLMGKPKTKTLLADTVKIFLRLGRTCLLVKQQRIY